MRGLLDCTSPVPYYIKTRFNVGRNAIKLGFPLFEIAKECESEFSGSCCKMGYREAQDGNDQRTAFRMAEKFYKRYNENATKARRRGGTRKNRPGDIPETDLSQVLDFRKVLDEVRTCGAPVSAGVEQLHGPWHWPVFTLRANPGFYFIPGAIPQEVQSQLTEDSLERYPEPPNRTNHEATLGPIYGLWKAAQQDAVLAHHTEEEEDRMGGGTRAGGAGESSGGSVMEDAGGVERNGGALPLCWSGRGGERSQKSARTLLRKMRWVTLGIQFDWAKRGYNEALPHAPFPPDLAQLAADLAAPAMPAGHKFKAEAAIINFYGPGADGVRAAARWAGGQDDEREEGWGLGLSIGCDAVFLLGGRSKDHPPTAMWLRSGDCVLMAGEARECYHGVPRILTSAESDAIAGRPVQAIDEVGKFAMYLKDSRININVRQVH